MKKYSFRKGLDIGNSNNTIFAKVGTFVKR